MPDAYRKSQDTNAVSPLSPVKPAAIPAASKEARLSALRARLKTIGSSASAFSDRATRTENALPEATAPGVHDIAGDNCLDYPFGFCFALSAAFAAAGPEKPVLICEQAHVRGQDGLVYPPGLAWLGFDVSRIVMVAVSSEKDLLWCTEEALACTDLGAVIVRLAANEKKYGFTESRRLQLRAESSGVPAYVVRTSPSRAATAGESIWRLGPSAGKPVRFGPPKRIIGDAQWEARIERARGVAPGSFIVGWRHETHRLHLDVPVADRLAVARTG